jgi:steroid delta-isomerase-like uncharacterized protein
VVERGNAAFNAHDLDGLVELYAPDAQFTGPGDMVLKGRDAIRQYTEAWFQGFPDAKITVENTYVDGETVVEEGMFRGTHTGVFPTPMGEVPPTGRRVEGPFVDVFKIRDGQVVSDRLTFDRMQLMEQLGLVPTPAGAAS